MHGDRGDIADGLHIPYFAEQFFLGEYVIGILRKKGQKVKLLGGELLLLAVHPHAARGLVDADTANLHDIVLHDVASDQALVPGKVCLNARYQLTWGKWLSHIVICAQSQTPDLINVILLGRNHKDWRILVFPNLAADFKAIHLRQHQVKNKQIKVLGQCPVQTALAIVLNLHLKTGKLQIILLQIRDCHLILNNQYSTHWLPPDICELQST